ncbi:MAG: hypothetical protein J0L65_16550 [Xanthomonadales bacterium]|nr:hypothetical protein [Xanthomonadales bacterium]
MNKIFVLMMSAGLALGLSACGGDKPADSAAAAAPVAQAAVTVPTDPADDRAWRMYLTQVVKQNMEGIRNSPFMYYLPAATVADFQDQFDRQADQVAGVVAQGVLPGNMLAFGGPEYAKMADLIIEAFTGASEGSMKDVRVLYIGTAADAERARSVVELTGATFVVVEAK